MHFSKYEFEVQVWVLALVRGNWAENIFHMENIIENKEQLRAAVLKHNM